MTGTVRNSVAIKVEATDMVFMVLVEQEVEEEDVDGEQFARASD